MARTRNTTTATHSSSNSGILARLRRRRAPQAHTTHKESTNPITGDHTVTTKTTSHPKGLGHHGHGGRGPMASTSKTTGGAGAAHHHRRKPSLGDKVSGGLMKLKGALTRRPGKKAAGTRRMHGTDGKGSHRRY